jgi:hypothetical protein
MLRHVLWAAMCCGDLREGRMQLPDWAICLHGARPGPARTPQGSLPMGLRSAVIVGIWRVRHFTASTHKAAYRQGQALATGIL